MVTATQDTVEARDIAELRQHVETLAVALSWWSTRDDSKPQPEVREYANLAVSTVDSLSRLLSQTRSRLLGEMRQSDEAGMRRTEKLLAQFERRTQCASTLDGVTADHTHRCALYVDAGPHTDTNHLCECGKQWGGA